MNLKKILFICGSIEPGQDGVGDYTRELAGAVQRLACNVLVIAIMDRVVVGVSKEKQLARTGDVNVVRLSQSLSFQKRKSEYQKITLDFDPTIISLQYVPYAFSPKGTPLMLHSFLKMKNRDLKWHFMLHEVYIEPGVNFKKKMVRQIQISILKSLVKKLQPRVIHTTNTSYQTLLNEIGVKSNILGLFGNISISQNVIKNDADSVFRGVYFGAPPKEENFQIFIESLDLFLNKAVVPMEITLCGQSGAKGKKFAAALKRGINSDKFNVVEKGRMAAEDLSELFLKMDFGIARIPPHLLGKSGSAVTMLEHGLPLWIPMAKSQKEIVENFDFRVEQCFVDLFELKNSDSSFIPGSRINEIAEIFTKSLNF